MNMKVNNFEILEVKLLKVDYKTNKAVCSVICSDNPKPLGIELNLEKGMEECAKELVQRIAVVLVQVMLKV